MQERHYCLRQGKTLLFSYDDKHLPEGVKKLVEASQVRSLLILPLVYQTTHFDGICLSHCQSEHQWTKAELKQVRILATQSAIALERTQRLQQLQQQKWQQTLLHQINQKLNSSLDLEQIVNEILHLIGHSFQVDTVTILSFDQSIWTVYQEWSININIASLLTQAITPFTAKEFQNLEKSFKNKHFINYHFLEHYLKFLPKAFQGKDCGQTTAFVGVAISIRGQFFGSLILQTQQVTRRFSNEEIAILEETAQQIAIALANLQAQERLEQLVRQRTQTLETEKKQVEADSKSKSEFLSHMNHELRTPLTGILGFSRMLQDEIYGSLNPKQKQYVHGIVVSGEHLLALVNDFLDLSKIEANREELFLETFAVEDVCMAALAIVQARAKEAGLDLHLKITQQVDFCTADQRRLKQILLNLLSNAIKFTEVGSVILFVERYDKRLEFSVIDTGIGIKKADQEKLFQPFQQINNPLSRQHKGTGLGLALSRKLAQLHGGDLTLSSQEDKGSCFTLHLPVIKA